METTSLHASAYCDTVAGNVSEEDPPTNWNRRSPGCWKGLDDLVPRLWIHEPFDILRDSGVCALSCHPVHQTASLIDFGSCFGLSFAG